MNNLTIFTKKEFYKKPISWLFLASLSWLIIGFLSGIFYDFFFLFGGSATFNNLTGEIVGKYGVFNEKIYVAKFLNVFTQLSVLHTHALVLGFVMFLIFAALEKIFTTSYNKKMFISSFVIYNIGLFLVWVFMIIRGIDAVLGIEYIKIIQEDVTTNVQYYTFSIVAKNPYKSIPSAITAIPHIIIAVGLLMYVHCILFAIKNYYKNKKIQKNGN